jgi:hypothetical protein
MVALYSLPMLAFAQQQNNTSSDTEPGMAFFEFLAELEQVDGEWVTPMDMQDAEQEDDDCAKRQEQKP